MMNKSGQGLPLNTIIIAIVVMVVLVVLIVIFTSQTNWFTIGLRECSTSGGKCVKGTECPSGQSKSPLSECNTGKICCINTGATGGTGEKRPCEDTATRFRDNMPASSCTADSPVFENAVILGDSDEYDVPEGDICCEFD